MRPPNPLAAKANPDQSLAERYGVAKAASAEQQYVHALFSSQPTEDDWLAVVNHSDTSQGSVVWKARAQEQLALRYLESVTATTMPPKSSPPSKG